MLQEPCKSASMVSALTVFSASEPVGCVCYSFVFSVAVFAAAFSSEPEVFVSLPPQAARESARTRTSMQESKRFITKILSSSFFNYTFRNRKYRNICNLILFYQKSISGNNMLTASVSPKNHILSVGDASHRHISVRPARSRFDRLQDHPRLVRLQEYSPFPSASAVVCRMLSRTSARFILPHPSCSSHNHIYAAPHPPHILR